MQAFIEIERYTKYIAMTPTPTQVRQVSRELPDIENLLSLNPRVQTRGSIVPSVVTKAQKKHWKRNADKSCVVCCASQQTAASIH